MEKSEKRRATIELGRKIAEDLGTTSRSDFLGGWMAHYIAELIGRYDNASGTEKEEVGVRAFDAILKLWNHRYQSPSGFDAIKRGEAILKTLSRLDPEEKRPFYFINHPRGDVHDGNDMERLFEMAMGVDRTARGLLKTLLLVMTIKGTDEETAEYSRFAMPDHLTDDLEAIGELKTDVDSDDFPQRFQALLQQLRDFGTLCMEFGSFSNADPEPE
ncbi:hypothetical protein OKA05_16885 [Luteolibacter arcticus]|uniref:Uncharacterized protein n=1 Tax=Luteolibacter arcticus TaxID=1581411 RepID=A0ABT3GL86_9BACT|nr:hypothetical protein [Luteolibacter arcticus]MCW1924245.1 hypothetical protein [Luteolibacter arcticus]